MLTCIAIAILLTDPPNVDSPFSSRSFFDDAGEKVNTSVVYDPRGRPTSINVSHYWPSEGSDLQQVDQHELTSPVPLVERTTLVFDPNGRVVSSRTSTTSGETTQEYEYDDENQTYTVSGTTVISYGPDGEPLTDDDVLVQTRTPNQDPSIPPPPPPHRPLIVHGEGGPVDSGNNNAAPPPSSTPAPSPPAEDPLDDLFGMTMFRLLAAPFQPFVVSLYDASLGSFAAITVCGYLDGSGYGEVQIPWPHDALVDELAVEVLFPSDF